MNILFMVDYWSPTATANSICARNVIEELKKVGYSVFVVAYADENIANVIDDGITISFVKPTLARRFLNKSRRSKKSLEKKVFSAFGKLLNRGRRLLLLPFYPIVSIGFARRWSKRVIQMVHAHQIDCVVSVIAPDDALYAGYLVKKSIPAIIWIPYYIDNGSNVLPGSAFERFKLFLQRKAIRQENNMLTYAAGIIVMKGHEQYYREHMTDKNKEKLYGANVPLFSQSNPRTSDSTQNEKEVWMYAGTMIGKNYAPQTIVDFFLRYRLNCDAELQLFGPTDQNDYLELLTRDKKSGISWHGMVDHQQLLSEYHQADVLVFYKNDIVDSVSGKFFEYLRYQKPIVYIGHTEDINAALVKKYAKGIVVASDCDTSTLVQVRQTIECYKDAPCNEMELRDIFVESTPVYTSSIIDRICLNEAVKQ